MIRPVGGEGDAGPQLAVFTVILPDLTPEEAVPEIAAAGFDGVEWRVTGVPEARKADAPSFWGNNRCTLAPTIPEAERARSLADAAGLAIPSLGTYVAAGDLEATEAAMEFALTCGAPQFRVLTHGADQFGGSYTEAFDATRSFLADVAPMARERGVKALVEIHMNTIAPSASLARRLVDGFDPECIGVLHDAGNMAFEGFESYPMGLELLGPYLAHVHMKNAAYRRPRDGGVARCTFSPFEDGVVDFDALFTALRDAGYNGWVSVEDFSNARPSREALHHAHDFLCDVISRAYARR